MRVLLVVLLLLVGAPLRAEWHVASSKHFVVYADAREDRVRDYASRLERFDKAFRLLRGFPDDDVSPSNRVTVYMVRDQAAIARLSNASVGGFYIPRAHGSVAFVPQRTPGRDTDAAERILFHEYTHHLMLTHYANVGLPTWLVEGFAEFHATAKVLDDGSVQFGGALNDRAYGLFAYHLPIERLLSGEVRWRDPREIDAVYGRGWLLTHYLTFDDERSRQLGEYLRRMNRGESPRQASAAFGDVPALGRQLDRYLRQRRISGITLPAGRLPIGPVEVRALSPAEAQMMPVHIRSTRGVDRTTAPAVLRDARRIAARAPADAWTNRVVAEAEYDVGNHQEAADAADRAIAADPRMVSAIVYRGMAEMELVAARDDVGDADWSRVRRWFLSANAIEPDAPMPLWMFHASFARQGREPTANARAALFKAQELAPHDFGLRMSAAMLALEGGDGELGRVLLRPVAYRPHGGVLAERAAEVITMLDGGQTDAALIHLRGSPDEERATATPD